MTRTAGFPHRLKILQGQPDSSVAGPVGSQDEEEGTWTPTDSPEAPSADTIYEDLADVQDKGIILARDQSGAPTETADAVAYLADESKIGEIKVGQTAEVTWEDGSVSKGRIVKVVRLDGSLMLKNL